MKTASEVKKGNLLLVDGTIFKVEEIEGKGSAKVHKTIFLKMRDILAGKSMEHTYNQDDKLEEADVAQEKAVYSYSDEDSCYFLNSETYDNYQVPKSIIGDKEPFLQEEREYEIVVYEGSRPLDVIFPERMGLRVETAPPGLRQHDSSTTGRKVMLENGIEIDVPQFIEEGDLVEVDTETGKYIDRVKE